MTGTTQPDPQVVACPRCMAPPGAACRTSGVGLARRPHESREVAVRRATPKPLTLADIPAGQGPASLFIQPTTRGIPGLWCRRSDGGVTYITDQKLVHEALWEHLAARLPHVEDAP